MSAPETDELAARTFTPTSGQAATDAETEAGEQKQQQQQEAQLMFVLEQGTRVVCFGALRAMRSSVAKRLPEINDEWTDEVLKGPPDALIPVLRRYAGALIELLGPHPELVALAFSLMPLVGGYMAAMAKHGNTVDVAAREVPASGGEG